jgi:hypothetical protein
MIAAHLVLPGVWNLNLNLVTMTAVTSKDPPQFNQEVKGFRLSQIPAPLV